MKPLRLVGYICPETGRDYVFLTNIEHLAAQTIADLYKARWQVELFFKWLKQNLKLKGFLGTSKNAVLTQIWAALCCQPAPRLSEVRLAPRSIDATDRAIAPAQLVPAPQSLGIVQERAAAAAVTARSMDG